MPNERKYLNGVLELLSVKIIKKTHGVVRELGIFNFLIIAENWSSVNWKILSRIVSLSVCYEQIQFWIYKSGTPKCWTFKWFDVGQLWSKTSVKGSVPDLGELLVVIKKNRWRHREGYFQGWLHESSSGTLVCNQPIRCLDYFVSTNRERGNWSVVSDIIRSGDLNCNTTLTILRML